MSIYFSSLESETMWHRLCSVGFNREKNSKGVHFLFSPQQRRHGETCLTHCCLNNSNYDIESIKEEDSWCCLTAQSVKTYQCCVRKLHQWKVSLWLILCTYMSGSLDLEAQLRTEMCVCACACVRVWACVRSLRGSVGLLTLLVTNIISPLASPVVVIAGDVCALSDMFLFPSEHVVRDRQVPKTGIFKL